MIDIRSNTPAPQVNVHIAIYDTTGAQQALASLKTFLGTPPNVVNDPAGMLPTDPRWAQRRAAPGAARTKGGALAGAAPERTGPPGSLGPRVAPRSNKRLYTPSLLPSPPLPRSCAYDRATRRFYFVSFLPDLDTPVSPAGRLTAGPGRLPSASAHDLARFLRPAPAQPRRAPRQPTCPPPLTQPHALTPPPIPHRQYIVVSVSQTDNPTQGWNHYYLDPNPSGANSCTSGQCLPDYPQFAVYNGYLVLTTK
jgi:hypothetical protein